MRVPFLIANVARRELSEGARDALIDTGATGTTAPRALGSRSDLPPLEPLHGRTAGGVATLEQSYACMEQDEKPGVAPILISDEVDIVPNGVFLLESLAHGADPATGRLVESEILLL